MLMASLSSFLWPECFLLNLELCVADTCTRGSSLNYFARVARVKPSGTKFQDLGVEILDQSNVQSILSELPQENINARAALLFQHKKKYKMWKLHLK